MDHFSFLVVTFGILDLSGGFSLLHALSVLTASTTAIAIVAARRHNVRSHRTGMIGTYLGLVGAFVGVVAVPGRSIPTFAGGQPAEFALWAVSITSVALALALSLLYFSRPRHVRGG